MASKKSNPKPAVKPSTVSRVGFFFLEHVYGPAMGAVLDVIAASRGLNRRLAAPSLQLPPDIMAPFWENRKTWSRNTLLDVRREFAEAALAFYAEDKAAGEVLTTLMAAYKRGEKIGISGFAQDAFMWSDQRALVLAALIRRDHEVANHVCLWTGIELQPINRAAIESKFERAWGVGLYANEDVTDPAILKS